MHRHAAGMGCGAERVDIRVGVETDALVEL
jgi:hypothetical protein